MTIVATAPARGKRTPKAAPPVELPNPDELARAGALAFQKLLTDVHERSEADFVATPADCGGTDPRNYRALSDIIGKSIAEGLGDHPKSAFREGYLRAMTDLFAIVGDGCGPGENWDPIETTALSWGADTCDTPPGHGAGSRTIVAAAGNPTERPPAPDFDAERTAADEENGEEDRYDLALQATYEIEALTTGVITDLPSRHTADDGFVPVAIESIYRLRCVALRLRKVNGIVMSILGDDIVYTTADMRRDLTGLAEVHHD